jgi:phosphocarrier protein
MKTCEVIIKHSVGLHARPAALFVQAAQKQKSEVIVVYENKKVNAKSLLGLLSLGITKDAVILILADGEDEAETIKSLVALVDSNFGE